MVGVSSPQSSTSRHSSAPQNKIIRDFKSGHFGNGASNFIEGDIPLGYVMERITFQIHDQLDVLVNLLPEYDDYQKTVKVLEFTKSSWYLVIKLMAIFKWILNSQRISHAFTVENFINDHQSHFIQTADDLAVIAREYLVETKMPSYLINSTIEMMFSSNPAFLPSCIKSDLCINEKKENFNEFEIIKKLNEEILLKFAQEGINSEFSICEITGGFAELMLHKKFQIKLTLVSNGEQYFWKIKELNFLLKLPDWMPYSNPIHSLQTRFIINFLESNMISASQQNKNPLDFMHSYLTKFSYLFIIELIMINLKKKSSVYGCQTIGIIEYNQGEFIKIGYWRSSHQQNEYKYSVKLSLEDDTLKIVHCPNFNEDLNLPDIFNYVDEQTYVFNFDVFFNTILQQRAIQELKSLSSKFHPFIYSLKNSEPFISLEVSFHPDVPPIDVFCCYDTGKFIVDHMYKSNDQCRVYIEALTTALLNETPIDNVLVSLGNEILLTYTIMSTSTNGFKVLSSLDIDDSENEHKLEFIKYPFSRCFIQFFLDGSYFLQVTVYYKENNFWVNLYLYFIMVSDKVSQSENNSLSANSQNPSPVNNFVPMRLLKGSKVRMKTEHPYLKVQKIVPIRDQFSFNKTVSNEIFKILRNFEIKQSLRDIAVDFMKSGFFHSGIIPRTYFDIISLHKRHYYQNLTELFLIDSLKLFLNLDRQSHLVYIDVKSKFELSPNISWNKEANLVDKLDYRYQNLAMSAVDLNMIKLISIAKLIKNFDSTKFDSIVFEYKYFTFSFDFLKFGLKFILSFDSVMRKYTIVQHFEHLNAGLNACKESLISKYLLILQHYFNFSNNLTTTLQYLNNFLAVFNQVKKFETILSYANASNKKIWVPVMDSEIIFLSPKLFQVVFRNFSQVLLRIDSSSQLTFISPVQKPSYIDLNINKEIHQASLDIIFPESASSYISDENFQYTSISISEFSNFLKPSSNHNFGLYLPFISAYIYATQIILQLQTNVKNDRFNNIVADTNSLKFSSKDLEITIYVRSMNSLVKFDLDITPIDNSPQGVFADYDFSNLKMFFQTYVAYLPFKIFLFISFCRFFKFPPETIKDIMVIIKANMNAIEPLVPGISLTMPFGFLASMFSPGSTAIAVKKKSFLLLNVTRTEKSGKIPLQVQIPVIYDYESNNLKVLDQATNENPTLNQIQSSIEQGLQFLHNSKTCVLQPCMKIILQFLRSRLL